MTILTTELVHDTKTNVLPGPTTRREVPASVEDITIHADVGIPALVSGGSITLHLCETISRYGVALVRMGRAFRPEDMPLLGGDSLHGGTVPGFGDIVRYAAGQEDGRVVVNAAQAPNERVAATSKLHRMHTDGWYMSDPPAIVALACEVNVDGPGADSILCSAQAMYDAAEQVQKTQDGSNRPNRGMQQTLCRTDAMRVKVKDNINSNSNSNSSDDNSDSNELPVSFSYPIFESIGDTRLRLRKFSSTADSRLIPTSERTTDAGVVSDSAAHKLQPRVAEASQFIEDYCHNPRSLGYLRHKLQPGDMLVMDNFGLTHGRLPYTMKPGQKRVLHRISFRNNGGLESKVCLGIQQRTHNMAGLA